MDALYTNELIQTSDEIYNLNKSYKLYSKLLLFVKNRIEMFCIIKVDNNLFVTTFEIINNTSLRVTYQKYVTQKGHTGKIGF